MQKEKGEEWGKVGLGMAIQARLVGTRPDPNGYDFTQFD